MIEVTADILARHEQIRTLEREIDGLEEREAETLRRLDGERDQLIWLLGALQRLAQVPTEALIARPEAPVEVVRTTMLLRAAAAGIEERAAGLRRELDTLASLRQDLIARRDQVAALRDRLDSEMDGLSVMVERRQSLALRNRQDQAALDRSVAEMAGRASDLRDLVDRLAATPSASAETLSDDAQPGEPTSAEAPTVEGPADPPESADQQVAALSTVPVERETDIETERSERDPGMLEPPTSASHDRSALALELPSMVSSPSSATRAMLPLAEYEGVVLPTNADVLSHFGDRDQQGMVVNGLVLSVFPGAPIVAPLDGEVRFAGIFQGYGEILILEHAGGYHSLITGVGRIDAHIGQRVLVGEPVGVTHMPQNGDSGPVTMYFELRHMGRPVNPLLGLAQAQARGQG